MFIAHYERTMRSARVLQPVVVQPAAPEPIVKPQRRRRLPVPIWVEDIIRAAAEANEVTAEDVLSRCRRVPIVEARAEAMYEVLRIGKPRWGLSPNKIGKWFGRDHASVHYLVSKYAEDNDLPNLTGYSIEKRRASSRRFLAERALDRRSEAPK